MGKAIFFGIVLGGFLSLFLSSGTNNYRSLSAQIPSVKAFSESGTIKSQISNFDLDYYEDSNCVGICRDYSSSSGSSGWGSSSYSGK